MPTSDITIHFDLLKVCGIITAIGAAAVVLYNLYKKWIKPIATLPEKFAALEKLTSSNIEDFKNETKRSFEELHERNTKSDEMSQQLCEGVYYLMRHAVTGNCIEELEEASKEFTKYLIKN